MTEEITEEQRVNDFVLNLHQMFKSWLGLFENDLRSLATQEQFSEYRGATWQQRDCAIYKHTAPKTALFMVRLVQLRKLLVESEALVYLEGNLRHKEKQAVALMRSFTRTIAKIHATRDRERVVKYCPAVSASTAHLKL